MVLGVGLYSCVDNMSSWTPKACKNSGPKPLKQGPNGQWFTYVRVQVAALKARVSAMWNRGSLAAGGGE